DPFVAMMNRLSVEEGALVLEVSRGSPAESAGLEEGDVIIQFGNSKIYTADDLIQVIVNSEVGDTVLITFVRGKTTKKASARLEETPPPWD
ncbi:MAG: PDZ domain-containing protein, partial [Dehalococcoidia bacterium]|nr:PDZ domain-containing protein [Dehalococcoidia bacterium]